eukprot:CAMPEP_0179313230 /NCGR_PEP_ID=MMETSP0797-20121207/53708_1 /TAXON_ID=47934 /ORGANISM="Dinophysis acuminata, Strain DAEP01" /LENGTH=107 /DNA_ID=CAMNT_0021023255 /DNA_START=213 /DNA_END=536 /DNA_ORIENTATION=-
MKSQSFCTLATVGLRCVARPSPVSSASNQAAQRGRFKAWSSLDAGCTAASAAVVIHDRLRVRKKILNFSRGEEFAVQLLINPDSGVPNAIIAPLFMEFMINGVVMGL